MKTYQLLFCMLLICLFQGTSAQVNMIPNPGFEDGTHTACVSHYDEQIDYWRSAYFDPSCGFACPTPDWANMPYCINTFSGYQAPPPNTIYPCKFTALLKSRPEWTEGVRTSLLWNLGSGVIYKIRLRMALSAGSVPHGGRIKVHFAEQSYHWNTQGALLENAATFLIYENKPHEWYTFESTFYCPPNMSNLGNIIIIRDVQDEDDTWVFIDDIELTPVSGLCVPNMLIESRTYIYPEIRQDGSVIPYEASKKIHAGFDVDNPVIANGDVLVKQTAKIAYKAGEEVSLKPGFSVERGAGFRAYIADCGKECKTPETHVYNPNNINICSTGVFCYNLGQAPKYAETYEWYASPEWGLSFLSSTTNPTATLCINTSELPNEFGNIEYVLHASNACNELCHCGKLLVRYDVLGSNRSTPVIRASNATTQNTTGLFECDLDLSSTTGMFEIEVYYTTDFIHSNPTWSLSPNGPYNYFEGIDYIKSNRWGFSFDVTKNGFPHPSFRFKFRFIAKNLCNSDQGEAWSDIYEYVGQ